MPVHPTYLVLSSVTLLFEIFCVHLFLTENHVVFVPSTTAKWIVLPNPKDRIVVKSKHNVLVHYVDVCAPDLSGVVFWNPFKWYILLSIISDLNKIMLFVCLPQQIWFISDQKSSCCLCAFHNKYGSFLIKNHLVVYVPSTPAKWISFHNQKNRKVVGGKHNF